MTLSMTPHTRPSLQHLVVPCVHSSRYWPSSTLLNFSDCRGTGVSNWNVVYTLLSRGSLPFGWSVISLPATRYSPRVHVLSPVGSIIYLHAGSIHLLWVKRGSASGYYDVIIQVNPSIHLTSLKRSVQSQFWQHLGWIDVCKITFFM